MMLNRRMFLASSAALAVPSVARAGLFSKDGVIFTKRGLAIRGTDPVAYFTQGGPRRGMKDVTFDWMGATWAFTSKNHRDAFAEDPEAYAPQFGGYCAWAVSRNYTASTDPEAWRIVDGKLYLNYSKKVQGWWEGDIPGNIAKGEANWPGLRADLVG